MAKYAKGQSGNPAGRPPGPNKVSREFRDTVRRLLEDNADNVSVWLEQVAANDPNKALDTLAKLAEYATPKLARTENHLSVEEKSHEDWLNGLE